MRNRDYERRFIELANRMEYIDTHGSRPIDAMRSSFTDLAKDVGNLEGQIVILGNKIDQIGGTRGQRFTAYAVAVIPLYVLLFLAVFTALARK